MVNGLTSRTETRRVGASATLDSRAQARLGQFFTPERAAALVASMPRLPESGLLRVLDPGAGVGSLAAALVQRVITEAPGLRIDLVAVEVDASLASALEATLADCVETASREGVRLSARVLVGDFIDLSTGMAGGPALADSFDVVIMNPPYAKLGARSAHRRALLLGRGVDCPNLYAAFMALGVTALRSGGQLVAITPRSFANGPYFERFRTYLLEHVAIDRLHTFASRSTVFSDTGVLQENIVLSGTRDGARDSVLVSASVDHTDHAAAGIVDYDTIVRPGDPHSFIRIAADTRDAAVTALMASMPATLADLGLKVSTGRVVDFRSRGSLRETASDGSVPLVYPGNLRDGTVEWPRDIRKPQGFAVTREADRKLLLPPGCYVVVKRFSAKEERRRIVAAVWDSGIAGRTSVAFENHLNVFHIEGAGIDRALCIGLSFWLNSSVVDRFFRTFSGHTQVNAADLRSLRFPSRDELSRLGAGHGAQLPGQAEIDALVGELTALHGEAA